MKLAGLLIKETNRAGGMAQWVRALTAKPGDPSWIPRTQMVEGLSPVLQKERPADEFLLWWPSGEIHSMRVEDVPAARPGEARARTYAWETE